MAASAAVSSVLVVSTTYNIPLATSSKSRSFSSLATSFTGRSLVFSFPETGAQGCAQRTLPVIEARDAPRQERRKVRHARIRRKLTGTTERPRLAVFRSNKHIYAQVIDDTQSHTVAAASTLLPALRTELALTAGPTIDAARRVGLEVAKIALEKGVTEVAFDRGGYIYHGRIAALADGAREGGLVF